MARKQYLNIGNSSKIFNVNLMKAEDIKKKIKVDRLNEDKIEKEMDKLAERSRKLPLRDDNEYIIYQEKYTNDTLIRKLINHGGSISYYTDSVVPYYVLQQLSMHTDSEVIYSIQEEFTDEQIANVNMAFMATRVTIDCPIIIPDISPYDFLFSLHDLKTDVDDVQLSFPPLRELAERHQEYYEKRDNELYYMKPMYQYRIFKYLQNSLSLWAMNIWLVAGDDYDHQELKKYIQKDLDKRSPRRKKKRKKTKEKVGAKGE